MPFIGEKIKITGYLFGMRQGKRKIWKPLDFGIGKYHDGLDAIYLGTTQKQEGTVDYLEYPEGNVFKPDNYISAHMVQIIEGKRYIKPTPVLWRHIKK